MWEKLLSRATHRERWSGHCLSCGVCCEMYGHTIHACAEDLERWRREGRDDLLARVGPDGEVGVDPATGERPEGCLYLVRRGTYAAHCGIHETKPLMCREYPTAAHGFRCVRGVHFPGRRFESSAL